MDTITFTSKPNILGNILVRLLSFAILVFLARFAYFLTVRTNSCPSTDLCFFSSVHQTLAVSTTAAAAALDGGDAATSGAHLRNYYSSVFHDLIAEGYLSPGSKALCIETLAGNDVAALIEIGVSDSVGISENPSAPLVLYGRPVKQPFDNNTFDFEFSGISGLDRSTEPAKFASEASRTLKPAGFFVVHTAAKDAYSLHSLLNLFDFCTLIRSREIDGIREIVLQKVNGKQHFSGISVNKCSVPGYKHELIRNAEPLIKEEPLKPWITFKKNLRNIRHLPDMVDISFRNRYVYVDVARNYGSSIGGWFKNQYPKQNKAFDVYAIEADKAFQEEYRSKKGVSLLPYVAWVRNETLFFGISRKPIGKNEERSRGVGRVQAVQSSSSFADDLDRIDGFDFASWLKGVVSERDYVVVKMDVEGSEFYLVPRLVETGAICLIDEIFLKCHYNRWQRCCPGERSMKYQKTYARCLELFSSLRGSGVLVHQWW
ncbi:hypothetical protein RJ640_025175 [Escallonia rubra]|uniref:DUF7870 domain-containing protein n=1 Tax=Escallonia rubra TaxID=112253 RepID=A0AA88R4U8_9ASTE|nr:hypothetical protein RJ640_025175 [Escallonia rubra]